MKDERGGEGSEGVQTKTVNENSNTIMVWKSLSHGKLYFTKISKMFSRPQARPETKSVVFLSEKSQTTKKHTNTIRLTKTLFIY